MLKDGNRNNVLYILRDGGLKSIIKIIGLFFFTKQIHMFLKPMLTFTEMETNILYIRWLQNLFAHTLIFQSGFTFENVTK